ncbi:hypothetical protein DYBT9275_04400 [Dyadobacter sp. CECT 9275]|uniref:Uncharacterized protein n=1 Tax=Dyadobacter helix TaxID=2822344 RepID=A0A916N7I8_9BACT|nr:hypothetical protein DYBT9275_04400 [Dyadobacter sp. CECT 9275]
MRILVKIYTRSNNRAETGEDKSEARYYFVYYLIRSIIYIDRDRNPLNVL